MKFGNATKLVVSIAICQMAGLIGSIFTSPSIPGWYATLQKPFFSPPNWVFAPVWILLFTLMGISLYLVWIEGISDRKVRSGILIFSFQLILNIVWSFLFFALQSPFYAFLEIIVLWFAILLTIYQFNKINRNASYLLVPYLFWVSFAAILNFSIWRLNL
ncbi:MAG: tryptophan-rich sensory protein [Methanosarcinaceae archaeon]|nr:tryptophan-rich sensory protein [Methanosarcinaceae archaeon]